VEAVEAEVNSVFSTETPILREISDPLMFKPMAGQGE
jgi:hypothetical protein